MTIDELNDELSLHPGMTLHVMRDVDRFTSPRSVYTELMPRATAMIVLSYRARVVNTQVNFAQLEIEELFNEVYRLIDFLVPMVIRKLRRQVREFCGTALYDTSTVLVAADYFEEQGFVMNAMRNNAEYIATQGWNTPCPQPDSS